VFRKHAFFRIKHLRPLSPKRPVAELSHTRKIIYFSVSVSYKKSFEKTRRSFVSFLMFKPVNFGVEMTEPSGITGNQWGLV